MSEESLVNLREAAELCGLGGGKINGGVAVSDLETSGAEAAHSPSSVDLLGGRRGGGRLGKVRRRIQRKGGEEGRKEDTEEGRGGREGRREERMSGEGKREGSVREKRKRLVL